MPILPLFDTGQQGKSSSVTAQRHLNLYAEQTSDKSAIAFYGTPGLQLFATFGDTPVRGGITVGDYIYYVHRGVFWQVNNAGVKVNRGTLGTTTGRVSMAYNGTQIAITDGTSYYVYTIATVTLAVVTANLIGIPIDVSFQDGYGLLAYADGKFQITSAYAFQTLNALDYATAESNPDGLVRIIADHGEVVLAGDQTVEFWGNTGANDFPYGNQRGSSLEFGLAAKWSLVKYNDSLAGLFKNRMGQVQVMMLAGHALRKISTFEIDALINGYSTVSDATAFSYMLAGHPMYQISFPTAGKSWLYDGATAMWSPLESGGSRHWAEVHVDFNSKPYVTDYSNGNIYKLTADAYDDNGTSIAREIVTKHFFQDYARVAISRLQVDFESGQGLSTGQGSDPQVMLQVSRDNGHTWSNERWKTMGAQGKYSTRVKWERLGMSRDWVFKLRITDPVKVVIVGASIDVAQ